MTVRRPSAETLRRRLVDQLEQSGAVSDAAVAAALRTVPRELFVPEALAAGGIEAVYRNEVIVTRHDDRGAVLSSSSQPSMMAIMLERLGLAPGQRVLEVGTGTGWNAALLATLVGGGGRVTSVELDPVLAAAADAALSAGGWPVEVVVGDGRDGWPAGGPYDRIMVTASATAVHRSWWDQLVPGGVLELPLRTAAGMQVVVTLRREDHGFRSVSVVAGGFLPLRDTPDRAPEVVAGATAASPVSGPDGQPALLLWGPGLAQLRPPARRRLVAAVQGPRRTGPLGRRATQGPLWLFLNLAAAPSVVYRVAGGRMSMGVLTGPEPGLAVLGPGPAIARLDGWGDVAAEAALRDVVEEWHAVGRPGPEQLSVTVGYGRRRPAPAWRTQRQEGAVVGFDWAR